MTARALLAPCVVFLLAGCPAGPSSDDAAAPPCGSAGQACCVAPVCGSGLACRAGICQVIVGAVDGTTCSQNSDCRSGYCLGTPNHLMCGAACASGTLPMACGGTCVDLSSDDANCGACGKSCGNSLACSNGTCASTNQQRYVMDNVLYPMARTDYAIDLNGDGNKDNQLGNIIGALTAQNLDIQMTIDASVQSGQTVHLVRFASVDATFVNDPAASVTLSYGLPTANPDFSGAGSFTVDNSRASASLVGALKSSRFGSASPVTTTSPVTMTMYMQSQNGGTPTPVQINGAHVQFQVSPDGLMTGEIHGSVKSTEIQVTIVPAIAEMLTSQVAANPTSSSTMQLLSIFDTGGHNGACSNPDGTNAKAGDRKIDVCEVSENSIIQNVLAPDVQIYDASGNYGPNKANTKKDSISFGVGFTAVKAQF